MHRSRKKQTQHLKPWVHNAILSYKEQTKAQTVKVLTHIDGPRTDGSIIREVTDGTVFIKAIFSSEALTEMFSEEGSTQPEWYSALLVLRKFTVSFDAKNCLERSEFVLQVESASIWDLQQGFSLKYQVINCMENSDVQKLARELYESSKMPQSRNETMDCSISLTQLMGNMSYVESQSQSDKNKDVPSEIIDEFEMKEFIISTEQLCILDNIEEWKPDYVPTIDSSQQSQEKSEENVQKGKDKIDTEKEKKNTETDEKGSNQTKNTRDEVIISSGESIRLSCSDYSETDIQVHNHGDDLVHSESGRVSSSSGGDNSETDKEVKAKSLKSINLQSKSEKSDKNLAKKRSDDYQKEFENFALNDESVTSTVQCYGETQPFLPGISPTSQPFSPDRDISLNDLVIDLDRCQQQETMEMEKTEKPQDKILHCKYYPSKTSGDQSVRNKSSCDTLSQGNPNSDQSVRNQSSCDTVSHGNHGNNSDQSLIDDTPEDDMLKSVKTKSNKEMIVSRKHKILGNISSNVKVKQEHVNISEIAEEERLNKLSDLSDELVSPENLLELLDKARSSFEDKEMVGRSLSSPEDNDIKSHTKELCNDLSQFQKSVSDKTLLEISSGLMKRTSDCRNVQTSTKNNVDISLDHADSQYLCYINDKSVDKCTRKKLGLRNKVTGKITNVEIQGDENIELDSSPKSLKRNRSDSQETDNRTEKYKKSNSGIKERTDSKLRNQNKSKNIDRDKIPQEKTVNAKLKPTDAVEHSELDDLPDSESLLGKKSSSREKSVLKDKEDVIIISSGDSIDCELSTNQNKDGGSRNENNVKNNVNINTEFAENRQRNPGTESEDTKTSSNQSDSLQNSKRQYKFRIYKSKTPPTYERGILSLDNSPESCLKALETKSPIKSVSNSTHSVKKDLRKINFEINSIENTDDYPQTSTPENLIDVGDLDLSQTSDIQDQQDETIDQDDSIVSQQFPQSVICKNAEKDKNSGGKQPKIPHTKMREFLADNKPKTEIGKRLLAMTIPSDIGLSAFNYYRNK